MFASALELAFEKLQADAFPVDNVVAISGSGQQHGSVYWQKGSEAVLSSLDSTVPLDAQLNHCFSIPNGPIWMDSTTRAQCKALEDAMGGAGSLASMTGSRYVRAITHVESNPFAASLAIAIEHTSASRGLRLQRLPWNTRESMPTQNASRSSARIFRPYCWANMRQLTLPMQVE